MDHLRGVAASGASCVMPAPLPQAKLRQKYALPHDEQDSAASLYSGR